MYCTYFYISNFVGFGDRILLALTLLGLFPYASSLTFFFFLILMACFFVLVPVFSYVLNLVAVEGLSVKSASSLPLSRASGEFY